MACRERPPKRRRTGGADRSRSGDTGRRKYHSQFPAWHPDTSAAPGYAQEAACAAAAALVKKLFGRKIFAQAKVPDSSFTQSFVHNLYHRGSCSLARPSRNQLQVCPFEEQVLGWLMHSRVEYERCATQAHETALHFCLLIAVQLWCCCRC